MRDEPTLEQDVTELLHTSLRIPLQRALSLVGGFGRVLDCPHGPQYAPDRRRTAPAVRPRTCRSSQRDQRCTYPRRSRRQSPQTRSDLPLTCHRPVTPGLTSSRWRSRRLIVSSVTGSGRGPTRDISPRRTLTSCGSSSIDQRRSIRPMRVTLGSWRSLNSKPSASLAPAGNLSAPCSMVRNFTILNSRPWCPNRTCL